MKVVNVSDKPYEVMFDAKVVATMLPNEVYEFDDRVAEHAIRKSAVLDDEGQEVDFRVKRIDEVDSKSLRLRCPLVEIGECKMKGTFSNLRELQEHMATHKSSGVTPVGKRDEVRL